LVVLENSDRIEGQLKAIGEKAEKKKMEVSESQPIRWILIAILIFCLTPFFPGHQATDRNAGAAAAGTKGIDRIITMMRKVTE
jgi:hypothetical protein